MFILLPIIGRHIAGRLAVAALGGAAVGAAVVSSKKSPVTTPAAVQPTASTDVK